jgi:hypothetical protein
VKNQAEQFSHYAIKAALNLVKAATQFAAAGGLTAHVAKVAEAVVKLTETAEELIYKVYQAKQLERAWALTREALSDPQNRRLGLMARGLNPTLAKYTIAWGAVVKRDSIAVSAMARIGLDRETLARRDASVGEVKRFLDTLYKDDQTVLGEFSDQEWPTASLRSRRCRRACGPPRWPWPSRMARSTAASTTSSCNCSSASSGTSRLARRARQGHAVGGDAGRVPGRHHDAVIGLRELRPAHRKRRRRAGDEAADDGLRPAGRHQARGADAGSGRSWLAGCARTDFPHPPIGRSLVFDTSKESP